MKTYLYILALLVAVCSQGHAEKSESIAEPGDYLIISADEGITLNKIYRLEEDSEIKLSNHHVEVEVIGLNQRHIENSLSDSYLWKQTNEIKVSVEIIKKNEIEERIKGGEIPIVLHGEREIKVCWVSKGTTAREFIDSLQESYPRNRFKFGINLSARSEPVDVAEENWEEIELIAHDVIFAAIPFT